MSRPRFKRYFRVIGGRELRNMAAVRRWLRANPGGVVVAVEADCSNRSLSLQGGEVKPGRPVAPWQIRYLAGRVERL